MEKVTKYLKLLLQLTCLVLIAASILSIFRNSENRFIKMLDFPRIQFFIGLCVCLVLLLFSIRMWKLKEYLLGIGLFVGIGIHSFFLINYTSLVSETVPTAENLKGNENQFSLLVTNVKMKNRNSQPLLELIKTKQPDLLLAMEVDDWWFNQLKELETNYPFSQRTINNVTYGMILYSKYPIENKEVNYLQNDNVPSFRNEIMFNDSIVMQIHCVHPVPPKLFEDLPDNENQEAVALEKLGTEIENRTKPTLVAGDLNATVWSYVDDLTKTENILNDVRVGRGFFNTYGAENIFFRWPLDHVFVTKEFKLKSLERLSKIGSDHFPIYVELVL